MGVISALVPHGGIFPESAFGPQISRCLIWIKLGNARRPRLLLLHSSRAVSMLSPVSLLAHAVRWSLLGGSGLLCCLPAVAQELAAEAAPSTTTLDTVSVLGSRTKPRTVAASAVPIDIVSGQEVRNQGATDPLDQLRVLVPSFNVSTNPADDAATFIRPANLRGLPPDNTLLMVNGKRFHRSALITFLGRGLSDGAQGPDMSVFPSLALEQVEVLRDGAAAQYGSDAIAGVINYRLKSQNKGGAFEVFTGQNDQGDGLTTRYSAQIGVPLTERGFATLTTEWGKADGTSRSVQPDAAKEAANAGYPITADPVQRWGSPKIGRDLKTVANLGLETDNATFYLFGNHARREVSADFYYRNPTDHEGIYSNDGGQSLLIGSWDAPSAACPSIALRGADGALVPYADVRAAVDALPAGCFTFLSSMPGGFTPSFEGYLRDTSLVAGAKGTAGAWYWDASVSWGRNEIDFVLHNSINASMGPEQPAGGVFHPGGSRQTERNVNLDLSRDLETPFTSQPLGVAAGLEWREEAFQVRPGDAASTASGPLAAQGFGVSSNGFNGFATQTAGIYRRRNWAGYLDLEAQISERLQLATALRYERYSTFGSTTIGKLTARYDLNDSLALRGAFNTGFRAPTPGQANISQIVTVDNGLGLLDVATLPPTNPIAAYKGAQPLKPETSRNVSLGAVWSRGDWLATLDGYRIKVSDRLAISSSFVLSDDERAALVAAGNPDAATVSSVSYFGNAFATTTTGADLVVSYRRPQFGGITTYSLAANWNQTRVDSYDPAFIDTARVYKLEHSLPKVKGYLSLNHQRDVFHGTLRLGYYGRWFEDHGDSNIISAAEGGRPIHGRQAVVVDVDLGWKLPSGWYVSVGAENQFSKLPQRNPWAGFSGAEYPAHSPYGFNGGFYYARLGWTF